MDFTIIEVATDSESPMIGTITNVNLQNWRLDIMDRLRNALEEHFDASVSMPDLPDLTDGGVYWDYEINIQDYGRVIVRILQTWMY